MTTLTTPDDPRIRDLLFFLGVIAALFIVWLASGGPERPQAREPLVEAQPERIIDLPSRTFRNVPTRTEGEWVRTWFEAVAGMFQHKGSVVPPVRFAWGVAGARMDDPRREFLVIALSPEATTSVSISGWKLTSRLTGTSVVIPQGVEDLVPQGARREGPIRLFPGDYAILTTGASPVGTSFLTNQCTGYLAGLTRWEPPLLQVCPNPAKELLKDAGARRRYGIGCLAYLARLPACAVPDSPVVAQFGRQCDAFAAQHYSYAACYARERSKPSFWGSEWRIFFGLEKDLWGNRHDIVDLIDARGNVVASLRY